MPHQHAEKVETLDASVFANWDLVGAYNKAKDVYPTFTEGDEGRQKALDWVLTELKPIAHSASQMPKSSSSSDDEGVTSEVHCIDIGCAHGQPTVQSLAEQGYDVVGVDLSDGLLGHARQNLAYLPNARFELADVRIWEPGPGTPHGKIDCVTTFYMLGHLPLADYEGVVAKLVRWLKPGTGVIVLSTVAHMHGWVTTRRATLPSTSLNIQENTALLERYGCEVVKAWEEEWTSKNIVTDDSRTHQFICARKK